MSVLIQNVSTQITPVDRIKPWVINGRKAVDQVASSEVIPLTVRITGIARYTINCLKDAFRKKEASVFPNCFKLLNILTIPFSLAAIVKSTNDFIRLHFTERVDAGLNIISNFGAIGDAIATFTEGLAAIGAVAAKAISWATPLMVVSVVLETAGIAATVKSMRETRQFKRAFDQDTGLGKSIEEYGLSDFKRGIALIEERRKGEEQFIGKHFCIDEDKFADRLVAIQFEAAKMLESNDAAEVLKGKKLLKTTMETLSKRMSNKNLSSVVSVIAGVISYIGVIALFTPASPYVGFGILALSGAVSLANKYVDKRITRRFEKDLGITNV